MSHNFTIILVRDACIVFFAICYFMIKEMGRQRAKEQQEEKQRYRS